MPPEIIGLLILTLAVVVLRAWLGIIDRGPTLYSDELYYAENARALATQAPYAQTHYPPLYSALVALGLLAPSWYAAMMAISAGVSALTVPATWFLGRSIGMRHPLLASTLVGLLPSGLAYSQYLMSENLSIPLFVTGLALAVRGRRREGWLLGVVSAGVFLTKYILLPALPVFVAVWAIRWWKENPEQRGIRMLAVLILRPVIPMVAIVCGWFAYATASGHSLVDAIGLPVLNKTVGGAANADPSNIVVFTVVYLGIIVLPLIPVWYLAVAYVTRRRREVRMTWTQALYALATILLTVGFLIIAVQHAYGAAYNIPEPSKATGRYVMHMVPCLIVLGILLFETLLVRDAAVVSRSVVVVDLIAICAVSIALWQVLYRRWLFDMPDWGARSPLFAADLFPMRSVAAFVAMLAVAAVSGAVISFRRPPPTGRLIFGVSTWLTVAVVLASAYLVRDLPRTGMNGSLDGSLGRRILPFAAAVPTERQVFILTDGLQLSARTLQEDSLFWQIDATGIETVSLADLEIKRTPADNTAVGAAELAERIRQAADCEDSATACFLTTTRPLPFDGGVTDDQWDRTVYFYSVG